MDYLDDLPDNQRAKALKFIDFLAEKQVIWMSRILNTSEVK